MGSGAALGIGVLLPGSQVTLGGNATGTCLWKAPVVLMLVTGCSKRTSGPGAACPTQFPLQVSKACSSMLGSGGSCRAEGAQRIPGPPGTGSEMVLIRAERREIRQRGMTS